ncbi:type II toxin-antitoxin system RelB/DinJ family antitoxin [Agathobaculum desmolans]|uniref:type II toxin-antitoxin system RelB/DinJ family antitoxin n=1 Tax=Agathobaculum desmolans TaxID=39484 RepID=UPI000557DA27|nr:type II toxin-antitoxin system RelB/DinJ family antitoxin [Agathobaculum desmolans]
MSAKPYSFRLEPDLKQQADQLFAALGLSTNAAVNMFLRQAVAEQAFPFKPALTPNAETRQAMLETLSGQNLSGPYSSAASMFAALDVEDDEP